MTAAREVDGTPISAARREGTTQPHITEEQKQNQKQRHHCRLHDNDAVLQASLRRWQNKSLCIVLLLLLTGHLRFCSWDDRTNK